MIEARSTKKTCGREGMGFVIQVALNDKVDTWKLIDRDGDGEYY